MNHIQEKERKTIALTGGSTGGHIFPLLSTYNYLKEENSFKYFWVGEEDSLEEEIANKNKIKFLDIPAGKIRRYFDWKNFYEPLKNLTGIFFGIFYILKYKIDIVFSKGGYVALPLCIAAFILRKEIYIHESDTVSGIANKVIGKIATKVFYTFPNEKTKDDENTKHIFSGQILNPELLDYIETLEVEPNDELSIIVMGGSQGSSRIFDALLKILPDFQDIKFQVILGEKNMHYRDAFKQFPNVMAHDFITQKRLGKILKEVDVAITRGGATTLWELHAFGIKSIIVPLSDSAGNHQNNNALYFNEVLGSDLVDETNDFEIGLYRKIKKYKPLRKTKLNLEGFFKPLQVIEKEINKTL